MKNKKITGLWVGKTLPELAQLCIKSFLDHGHEFQLFTYRHYDNIPEGTTVRDAREILPEDVVFTDSYNSYASFSDWFRMKFLAEEGGIWTDLDVICLRDDLPIEPIWSCRQDLRTVATGFMAFPAQHIVPTTLCAMAADPANPAPWDNEEELLKKEELKKQYPDVRERRKRVPWGYCGPVGMTKAMAHFGLFSKTAMPSQLYPIRWMEWQKCYDGTLSLSHPQLCNAWAIHVWGEKLRQNNDCAWENMNRFSIVGELLDKHFPQISQPVPSERKKKVNILVGICSCLKAAERRRACRETWLSHPHEGVECVFFLGRREPLADESDVVTLWSPDDYHRLPRKGLNFYKWALENYDFEWLFKCDDDTYLDLQRLEQICDDEYDLIGDISVEKRGAPSGGAGYFLKRSMVERIVSHYREIPICGAEDIVFGDAVRNLGGKLKADSRLYMGNDFFPTCNNAQVSCHWCSPQRLRDVDMMLHQKPAFTCMARHSNWQDTVVFYPNGRFMRKNAGCSGSYRIENERSLVLEWDSWPAERLSLSLNFSNETGFMLTPDASFSLSVPFNLNPETNQ